jgi:hypothetical protein
MDRLSPAQITNLMPAGSTIGDNEIPDPRRAHRGQ